MKITNLNDFIFFRSTFFNFSSMTLRPHRNYDLGTDESHRVEFVQYTTDIIMLDIYMPVLFYETRPMKLKLRKPQQ